MRSRVSVSVCSTVRLISENSVHPARFAIEQGSLVNALASAMFGSFGRFRQRKRGLGDVLMLRSRANMNTSAAFFKAFAEPQGIEARQIQQGQKGRNEQTSHDG